MHPKMTPWGTPGPPPGGIPARARKGAGRWTSPTLTKPDACQQNQASGDPWVPPYQGYSPPSNSLPLGPFGAGLRNNSSSRSQAPSASFRN